MRGLFIYFNHQPMNIFIISTPGVDSTLRSKIVEFSRDKIREIKIYSPTSTITNEDIGTVVKNYKVKKIFEFSEFFEICRNYRNKNSIIKPDDFVVLLTNKQNTQGWFSAVRNRNIFIDINNWETITKKASIYSITHQLFENIFQSLIGIEYNNVKGNKNIHTKSIGCVNDFCDDPHDVVIKLTSANICHSCIEYALKKKVDTSILHEIVEVFEKVRKEIRTSIPLSNIASLKRLRIDSKGNIYLGDDILKMTQMATTLYIYFLLNNNNKLSRLSKNKEELIRIYTKLKPEGNKHRESVERLVDLSGKRFNDVKYKINDLFKSHLNNLIVHYYQILPTSEKPNGNYHIALPSEYLEIDPNFSV